ncbi:MAG: transketolase C-terminal domain-containing protein, partial [Hyphomicrobiales bacterium]
EALCLAASSEIPIVLGDVMRGGPATGIPTKSEQSDLNIAVYGCHGDAPHVVVAPLSVADCVFTAQWAVFLAEAMQTPAIVLSDQSLGQARALIERPANLAFVAKRHVAEAGAENYQRYALSAANISPMAIPGTPGGQYTADGLTHNERGTPSTKSADHLAHHDKRLNKIASFDYGDTWAAIEGIEEDGAKEEFTILTWGSLTGAAREAQRTLAEDDINIKLVSMRLIAPFLKEKFLAALNGAERILIVEQTHSGQFHDYLRAKCDLPGEVRHFHRPGPQLIGAAEICAQIRDWKAS